MSKKNDAGMLHDLMAAKAEAKEKMRELSEDALAQIVGGKVCEVGRCPHCKKLVSGWEGYILCPFCNGILPAHGDERDMDEELADISGLTEDLDGFVE